MTYRIFTSDPKSHHQRFSLGSWPQNPFSGPRWTLSLHYTAQLIFLPCLRLLSRLFLVSPSLSSNLVSQALSAHLSSAPPLGGKRKSIKLTMPTATTTTLAKERKVEVVEKECQINLFLIFISFEDRMLTQSSIFGHAISVGVLVLVLGKGQGVKY